MGFHETKKEFITITKKLFAYFLIAYLFLLIMEQIKAGFASKIFSLNYFLVFIVILGVIILLLGDFKEEVFELGRHTLLHDFLLCLPGAVVGALVILFQLKFLGGFAYLVALFSALIILGVCMVVISGR